MSFNIPYVPKNPTSWGPPAGDEADDANPNSPTAKFAGLPFAPYLVPQQKTSDPTHPITKIINYAQEAKLMVTIDLHGAPSSRRGRWPSLARPGGSFDARVVDAACKPRASEDARAEVGHPRDERAAGVAFSNCLCHGVTTGRTRPSDPSRGF